MPQTVSIIDTVLNLPLDALQQVLDTSGPYAAGDHTLTQFTTTGGFVLPAGTYQVHGTYGVIWQANGTFPPEVGVSIGYSDPLAYPVGDIYEPRLIQVVPQVQLPTTGLWVATDITDGRTLRGLVTWPLHVANQRLGIHITPGWAFDLFYLCIG